MKARQILYGVSALDRDMTDNISNENTKDLLKSRLNYMKIMHLPKD